MSQERDSEHVPNFLHETRNRLITKNNNNGNELEIEFVDWRTLRKMTSSQAEPWEIQDDQTENKPEAPWGEDDTARYRPNFLLISLVHSDAL